METKTAGEDIQPSKEAAYLILHFPTFCLYFYVRLEPTGPMDRPPN